MNFLDKLALKRVEKIKVTNQIVDFADSMSIADFLSGKSVDNTDNLSEVTYFTCLKILYETIGKLSFNVLKDSSEGTEQDKSHEAYTILKLRPNPHMTPTTFKQIMELNRNHYGNAYALIQRNGSGRLQALVPLDPQRVRVLVDDQNILGIGSKLFYKYTKIDNQEVLFHEGDILHFKFSLTSSNGLVGKSVQEVLANTMQGAKASQKYLNTLYQNGMTASAVLEYVSDLSQDKIAKLVENIEGFGAGYQNAGRIVPIPPGTSLKPLDLKLSDSQFFELKRFNALQIASVFGVKPTQINDFEKASYASSEAQNLNFYIDTMLSILRGYEEELDYKLLSPDELKDGYHIRANVSSILRADLKTQSEILCNYIQNGIMTPNEARGKIDLTMDNNGNTLMANGNFIPLSDVGVQYQRGGE